MKTLYLDCSMGAAGDMLAAALLELHPDPAGFLARFNALGLPGVEVSAEPSEKCGVRGTHVTVRCGDVEEDEHLHDHHHDHDHVHHHDHDHEQHHHAHEHAHHHRHSGLADIEAVVAALALPEAVRADVLAVYGDIAAAESRVHGVPVPDIHFHEVGTLDAVADVTAVCLLLHELSPARIAASPVHVGAGTVRCAHGVLPVPAPATAELLKGLPIYGGEIKSELCTPTGAALLKHYVNQFGPLPPMTVSAVGYGMGKKDFPQANCVRALLGETAEAAGAVTELGCNVDDMTGEDLGFAMEQIYTAGAVEVFTIPAGMKKSRPGVLLKVICPVTAKEKVLEAIFRHTSTIGVRETAVQRHVLTRRSETVETPLGPVRRKVSEGCGVKRSKWEYEDLARIAREKGLSLAEVRAAIEAE